jgi:hypothetical protein
LEYDSKESRFHDEEISDHDTGGDDFAALRVCADRHYGNWWIPQRQFSTVRLLGLRVRIRNLGFGCHVR